MEVSTSMVSTEVLLYNESSVPILILSVTHSSLLFFDQVFALVALFRIFPPLRHMANGIISMSGRRVSETYTQKGLYSYTSTTRSYYSTIEDPSI
jgi:hypothetical protein